MTEFVSCILNALLDLYIFAQRLYLHIHVHIVKLWTILLQGRLPVILNSGFPIVIAPHLLTSEQSAMFEIRAKEQ